MKINIYDFFSAKIIKYFLVSCGSAIVDIFSSLIFYKVIGYNYILSTNIGIVLGLVFHYIISMRFVFEERRTILNSLLYIFTWFLGLALANLTMYIFFNYFNVNFLISKFFSMVVPFFFTYFIRNNIFNRKG